MIKRTVVCLLILIVGSGLLCHAQSRRVADQEPDLRDALVRDASCDIEGVPGAPAERNQLLLSQVSTQAFHGAARATGVIARPTGGCYCRQENCSTYVYVKSGQGYRLVLKQKMASLRPMRVFKRGYPSLTGKVEVKPGVAETVVFDWNGTRYQAALCATVTQTRNPRRPVIARHECRNSGSEDQP